MKVYPGAAKPLIGDPHPAVDIHGNDGLGGVEGLPYADSASVLSRIVPYEDLLAHDSLPAIQGIKEAAQEAVRQGKKLYLGVTGSATNAAIFILAYPTLAKAAIQQIVTMGGGIGIGK